MNRFSIATLTETACAFAALALAALCLAVVPLQAQKPAAAHPLETPAPESAADDKPQTPAASQPNPDDEWLAKTSKLYYSSAKAGLTGFDCNVHPDWRGLIASALHNDALPPDDTRLALVQSSTVALHSHLRGGVTFAWSDASAAKALDQQSAETLTGFHQTVEQMLESFLQFWTPFIENSVVPDSAQGLDITHTPTVHTIHARQGDTELTEVFSNQLILEEFNVNMSGTSIKFFPSYHWTPQGLLVSNFRAHVNPVGTPADEAQDMTVDVHYQPVNGFPIPDKLNIEVIGTGKFDFALDGCATSAK
jgi:hypothetical protein